LGQRARIWRMMRPRMAKKLNPQREREVIPGGVALLIIFCYPL
jgi:hypothetical protein